MYKVKLRVHIAPVGYENERIYKPVLEMKADRVWLLVYSKNNKAQVYQQKVEEVLKQAKIECKTADCDITDLYDVLKVMRKIVNEENGNEIFINVSSGSKIEAIAGMMMSMIMVDTMDIHSYYVVPEGYINEPKNGEPLSSGTKEVFPLPSYPIEKPAPQLIEILKILKGHNGRMTKKELAQEACASGLIKASEKNPEQSKYASLTKKLLQPLEKWNLVKIIPEGRNKKVKLTIDGENMLKFLG